MGYHSEYSSNNDTYIVARKFAGDSGVGATKIYKTQHINIDATKDLEYNYTGGSLYNPCSNSQYNKDNQYDCNMYYENVGFNAYIPLNELYPNKYEKTSWRLYIVKEVSGHLVYTELRLPFSFNPRNFNSGKISLSSGVNPNQLTMIGTDVLREDYAGQTATQTNAELGADRYFTEYQTYTEKKDDENHSTSIWFGVYSPKDKKVKGAPSVYWLFGGTQAKLTYYPPPKHIKAEVWSRYHNGNDYWAKPGDTVYMRMTDYSETGNNQSDLRLSGSGVDVRSSHHFDSSSHYNHQYQTNSHVTILTAYRDKSNPYGRVKWGVVPHVSGDSYNIEYLYNDVKGNHLGYNDTGKNLRVDGVAPSVSISPYSSGWRNSNLKVGVKVSDSLSGVYRFRYQIQHGSSWGSYSGWIYGTSQTLTLNHQGRNRIHVEAEDHVGNIKNQYSGYYYLDPISPTVTFSPNSHSWTQSNLNLAIHVSDSLSGVKRFRYQTKNGSSWTSYSGWIYGTGKTLILNKQGKNQIHVQAEDQAGNYHDAYSGYYYIDKVAPNLVSDGVTNFRYHHGNDYWVRPNDQLFIWMRQYDGLSGNRYQYLRLYGSGVDARSQHDFSSSSTFNNYWDKSSHVTINSARRQENSAYGKVNWGVVPKVSGDFYNIDYYFTDRAGNSRGYGDTGKNLRVDGVAPTVSMSPNSHSWTNPNLSVDVKVSDSLSGVKRFRYQVQHGSSWGSYSGWVYGTQKTITLNQLGKNRIHVEAEDNVGNIRYQYSGYYYIDAAPIAKFHFNPSDPYEGDPLKIVNDSTDPDGNQMTADWSITAPGGKITHQSSWDAQIKHTKAGTYKVDLKVSDPYGRSSTASKTIMVHVLSIQGTVQHTPQWKKLHNTAGDPPEAFYSGETFLLSAQVTNHPIQSVQVEFIGDQINGNQIDLTKDLTADPFPTYVGQLYDPRFSDPQQLLSKGTDYFQFTATWQNGTVKSCLVPVQIIGNVYQVFLYHRTS